jgi:hypothetical protein
VIGSVVSVTLAVSMLALAAAATADCTAAAVETDAGVCAGAGVTFGAAEPVVLEQPARTTAAKRSRARFI